MLHFIRRVLAFVVTRRLKNYSDPFTYRLTQIVPGMFEDFKIWQLDQAIGLLPEGLPVVEIGSFCRRSTNLTRYFLDKHNKKNPIFSCDIWSYGFKGLNDAPLTESTPISGDAWAEHAKNTFLHHTAFFSHHNLPHSFHKGSTEFFPAWAKGETQQDLFGRHVTLGGAIGLCFIDGNHSYEAVKEDFALCDPFISAGSLVWFDDSGWPYASPGVAQFMREFRKTHVETGRYEIISRNPHYLTRKLK